MAVISYEDIFNKIATKIYRVANNYSDYTIIIEQERQFVRRKSFTPKTVYFVVSFGQSSFNPWQAYTTIGIMAVSEENSLDIARGILADFASQNNLITENGVLYTWSLPVVNSQFNEVASGFRALLSISGSALVNINVSPIESIYYEDAEGNKELITPLLSVQDGYQASIAPQAFPNGNGFALSETRYGTYTITFGTYLITTTSFGKALLKARFSADSTKFKFIITIGGEEYTLSDMVLISIQTTQSLGQLPTMTMSFTR